METFDFNDKKYISINGKDYFLVRGYRKNRDNFIFIQVHGRTPLHKEDLPSKEWDIVPTKSGADRVWTAYQKKYFKYETQAADPSLAFIGASTQGSYFIALLHICKRFAFDMKNESLNRLAARYAAEELENHHLNRMCDEGNSGMDAILIAFERCFDDDDARRILKIKGDDPDE